MKELKEKILITGGSGYIGSTLIPWLLDEGYAVTAVDNLMYNQATLMDYCHRGNFDFIRGDARDEGLIKELLKNADIVIPLACLTGAPLCERDPWAAESVMVDAINLLLKNRSSDQLMLYPNTNSGYGIGEEGKYCTEESPLRPVSLYGRLKVEAENRILDSGNCVSFRLATVFGAAQRMRIDLLVNDFVYRAVTDRFVVLFQAEAKRNYIHIRDVVKGFIHALNNWDTMKNNTYNMGLSDANLSKRELCEKIRNFIPEFYFTIAEIGEDPDKRDYIVSNEKIESTGYCPSFSLDDGIKELIKVYKILKLKRNDFTNNP